MTPQSYRAAQVPALACNHELAGFFEDPFSVLDTSGGNPRLHAYRRIALAAYALGWDYTRTCAQLGAIDTLGQTSLEALADALETQIDARVYG